MIKGTYSALMVGYDLAEKQESGLWHRAMLLCGFILFLYELMARRKPNRTASRMNDAMKGASR
jgi:hypothetical protein